MTTLNKIAKELNIRRSKKVLWTEESKFELFGSKKSIY